MCSPLTFLRYSTATCVDPSLQLHSSKVPRCFVYFFRHISCYLGIIETNASELLSSVHLCTDTHTHTHMHVYPHARTHAGTYTHVHAHVHTYTHMHILRYTHSTVHARMHSYTHACVCPPFSPSRRRPVSLQRRTPMVPSGSLLALACSSLRW